jgi:hypothetical protein
MWLGSLLDRIGGVGKFYRRDLKPSPAVFASLLLISLVNQS